METNVNTDIDLIRQVLEDGQKINSRYGPCIEFLSGCFCGTAGELFTKKGMNYSLGWMELLQLVGGVFDPEAIKRVAPNANHSLFTYPMAYGPRIVGQMEPIIEKLKRDSDTRQAVLFIAKPEDGPTSDLPCTLSIQFFIRNEQVDSVVSMRSWDLCRGMPYDWIMFSGLTDIVASCLGLDGGIVVVNAGSAHIYEDQMEGIPRFSEKRWKFVDGPTSWKEFVGWAKNNIPLLQKGGTPGCIEYVTDTE